HPGRVGVSGARAIAQGRDRPDAADARDRPPVRRLRSVRRAFEHRSGNQASEIVDQTNAELVARAGGLQRRRGRGAAVSRHATVCRNARLRVADPEALAADLVILHATVQTFTRGRRSKKPEERIHSWYNFETVNAS